MWHYLLVSHWKVWFHTVQGKTSNQSDTSCMLKSHTCICCFLGKKKAPLLHSHAKHSCSKLTVKRKTLEQRLGFGRAECSYICLNCETSTKDYRAQTQQMWKQGEMECSSDSTASDTWIKKNTFNWWQKQKSNNAVSSLHMWDTKLHTYSTHFKTYICRNTTQPTS